MEKENFMIDYLRELNFVSVALRLLLSAAIGFPWAWNGDASTVPPGAAPICWYAWVPR